MPLLLFQHQRQRAPKAELRPALDNPAKVFRIDDDASTFPQDYILAVEFIEIFRDLLARRSDNAGECLVTDREADQGSTRIVRSKMIRQIGELESYSPAHVEADASNAVDV